MADGSSPSPDQSPPSESPPPPPSDSSSSSSPPPSSPPPSPPPEDSPPPSPPPPSPPPPSEKSSPSNSSPPSPPPPPPSEEETSSSPPSPPNGSDSNNNDNNNNNDNDDDNKKSSPSNNNPSSSSSGENDGGGGKKNSPTTPQDQPAVPLVPPGSTYTPPSPSSITDESSSHGGGGSKHNNNNVGGIIAGVVVGGGILLFLMVACIICMRRKKKRSSGGPPPYGWDKGGSRPHPQGNQYWQTNPHEHAVNMPPSSGYGYPHPTGSAGDSGQQSGIYHGNSSLTSSPSLTLGFNKSTFTYDELSVATNGFDKAYMLGQGGFGYVHKGVLPNGKEIAVKSLKSGSGQGEREFQAEVDIISRVHHRHLVSLVGYCIAGGQRMLVYEFVPNDTLEYHLHKKGELDFPTRLRIALGGAKGLAYLHEDCHPRIIHRDIKASNILLDEKYEAKVADFGLAKLTTDTNTHVSTRVMGTFGYLAPEYASSGKLTEKSDVFSFGVMLLEIITGRRPVDSNMNYMEDSLVDWSRPLLAKSLDTDTYHEIADPRMEGNYDPQLMKRMVACAAAAVRHSAKRRPKMSQIVRALEGDVSLDALNDGSKPGQGGMLNSSDGSSEYDTRAYSADLKKFRQLAFDTKDFSSSEYEANPSSSWSDNSREMNSKNMHS